MNKDEIKYFMEIAYEQACIAEKKGEVPIGCLIVCKNSKKIISKSYNQTEISNDPTAHAEILAIRKACKKINDWRLTDYVLFTTLEPCKMCAEIIKESRIKEVYYGTKNLSKNKNIKKPSFKNMKIDKMSYQLKGFFKKIRN